MPCRSRRFGVACANSLPGGARQWQARGVHNLRSVLPQVAGMIGNVLEWYDFAAYGFLAASFAANFFPLETPLMSLMASYGVFAVAFVAPTGRSPVRPYR
jgi:hypothetical protein